LKKDIKIPEVKEVYLAVVQEKHPEYNTLDWNAYIINNSDIDKDTVLIVSKGYSDKKVTPPMRHSLKLLPARSYAKIEYLQEKVLALNNEFKVTYFEGNSMFEKTYVFRKNTINTKALQPLPLMTLKGVLVK
jgi:glutamate mutase epsilon subunit